ncbi:MAG: hypothetical protein ACR2RE_25415, partial [Geminicoccaceae bacterium]
MRCCLIAFLAWGGTISLLVAEARADIELKVARFFDPCIEGTSNIEQASGEACIVQALFNAFSDE